MKKINLELFCKIKNENHDFELLFLPSSDVLYKCKNCEYEFLDIVEKQNGF
jgi:hypothetical protein